MQFGVGVEYAFHTLFYMVELPKGKTIGIKDLANLNNISETYLSKMFTKLKKSDIVRSISGVKGGYELQKRPEDISLWDIVESIEGSNYFFTCAEIRQNNIFAKGENCSYDNPCLIKTVMTDAENQMRNYLKNLSLKWLYDEASKTFSDERKEKIQQWILSF